MFNKYLLLLVGLLVTIYVPTINAYGYCTCFCCDGSGCEPMFDGSIEIPSCDGSACLEACKKTFPLSCNITSTGKVKPDCKEVKVINETTTTTQKPTPSSPWPGTTTMMTTTTNETTSNTTLTTTSSSNSLFKYYATRQYILELFDIILLELKIDC
ncbi:unnamed protein product [Rotaria sp. Silwood2]|nr:unnamed protein product [Rotaria sp. Silwood2]